MFDHDFIAFSEASGILYGFQDTGSGIVLTQTAWTHRPGLIDLTEDDRLEMVATDASEKKMLYFLERCSNTTPPGKLYADAYADGRVNYHFEYLPGASKFEVTVRNPEEKLLYRSILVTNLERVTDVPLGKTYIWQVRAQCNDGSITPYSERDTIIMPALIDPMVREENPGWSNNVKVSYPDLDRVLLSTNGATVPNQLSIYDMQGRLVFVQQQIQIWPVVVDHSTWPSGIYLIQLSSSEGMQTSRMVVQH
jgi:hypothetical protein